MARTKIKRRAYNLGTSQQTENSPREADNSLVEETPQDGPVNPQQDECPGVQAKASEMPPVRATLTGNPDKQQSPETTEQEDLTKTVSENSTTTPCPEEPNVQMEQTASVSEETVSVSEETIPVSEEAFTITSKPQESTLDKNDDSLELDWSISGHKEASATEALPSSYVDNVDVDDSLSISRDSPLNLAWDSSMKENYQQQANAPNFRPMTPDNLLVPVDDIFSPKTQKEIRTTIRALFPNGPPPPPPVRPMRRPKKGDEPYIVNCTKRPRVPSPKCLTVFTGDKYGITSNTNYDVDEPEDECTPEKRAKRGFNKNTSKSTFNRQTNEIAERLKLYEKIDRLVGRTPKEPVGYMTKRSFSPLPSTSTDNETIMKNDKHFSESLNCDFEIDEDDDLPEVIWDSNNYKKEKDRNDLSSPLVSKNIKIEKYDYTDSMMETNEDMNNNNNDVIAIDDDFCEIQFDKYMPKEKILDYSDVEPTKESENAMHKKIKINDYFPPQPKNQPSGFGQTASTDVICVDDIPNVLNPMASTHSVNSPVLRASNKNATATETRQSDLVIEVPDVLEPVNMSRHAPNRPAWNEEVQFVSEEIIERPNSSSIENISDVQVVSQPSSVGCPANNRTPEIMNQLQQILACFTEQYSKRKTKKKNKRTKSKENLCATSHETASVNDENTAPIRVENASVNNENAAPSVNQVASDSNSMIPSANSSPSKRFGECPICLDNLQRGSIASTNCGHVFCLECIKQSLKSSGKRCPTCRKQLKGVGYHQVFL